MDRFLKDFIMKDSFPCIMAKAVLKKGFVKYLEVDNLSDQLVMKNIISEQYAFIDQYRTNSKKLSSFILKIRDPRYLDFEVFQSEFWRFLKKLRTEDRKLYPHDHRVASDPMDKDFSFSLKEEAFFILTLHPKSPRFARRFRSPLIVFNPHQQFEALRIKGVFKKVRDTIRKRDFKLQGSINPMLSDYGESSEVFQYMGIQYPLNTPSPL